MSSKDMLASSKSMKTNSDAASTSNPANTSSRQSIASLSKTSVPSSTGEPIRSVKSSTCLPQGMGMAKNTTTGSAAPIRRLPIVSMPPSAKSVTSQPLVPKSAKGTKLIPDGATRSTKLHRDDITSQSKKPYHDDIISQGTKLYRDDISKGTMLYRDDIDKGTKLFRDDIDQGTKLHRDDIEKGTKLNRDDISQGTMLFRDVSRSMAPPGTKSIFLSPRDISMASRQTQIELLPPKERDEQEQWAQELIRRIGACPEGYDWTRMPGGYQCKGRGHAITDDMLEEGKGGIWALPTKKWEEKEGPYYLRNGEFRKVKPSDQGP